MSRVSGLVAGAFDGLNRRIAEAERQNAEARAALTKLVDTAAAVADAYFEAEMMNPEDDALVEAIAEARVVLGVTVETEGKPE